MNRATSVLWSSVHCGQRRAARLVGLESLESFLAAHIAAKCVEPVRADPKGATAPSCLPESHSVPAPVPRSRRYRSVR